jgi:hypothetical protein
MRANRPNESMTFYDFYHEGGRPIASCLSVSFRSISAPQLNVSVLNQVEAGV